MIAAPSPAVLVVDDSDAICLTLSMMLEKHGFRSYVARHSEEALQMASQRQFDAVLLDVDLAGESGIVLGEQLIDLNPCRPIVLMSGSLNLRDDLANHPKLSCTPVLEKPFTRKELLTCLDKVVRRAA